MPRWAVLVALPVALVVAFVAVWAVDTAAHAGEVPRNVTVGGDTVGGLGDDDLRDRVEGIAARYARTPVIVETPDGMVDMTVADIGVAVDVDATIASVHDQSFDGFVLAKPFDWFGSLFGSRAADIVLGFDPAIAATTLSGFDPIRTHPVEPVLDGSSGELVLVEGINGQMLDIEAMIQTIPAKVAAGDEPIEVEARWTEAPPRLDAEDYAPLIAEAEQIALSGARLQVNDYVTELPADVASAWFHSEFDENGDPVLIMNRELADADIRRLMEPGGIGGSNEAVYDIVDGEVVVTATEDGRTCCLDHALSVMLGNIRTGRRGADQPIELPVRIATPEEVLADAERLAIVEEVATFTTHHPCCQSRVTNIQRFADIVRGTIIEPGETMSLNAVVGRRTRENGFVSGGFIQNGVLISDIGGGVSQFATTIFNTAFFAGLDFPEYQAHSIYFTRYPYGREATISWPVPDLKIENTTPHGILIWTSYTPTSITVTMYSTKYVDVEQTSQRTVFQQQCRRVTTERTRTYLDGRVEVDTVGALYRPKEGLNCDGSPSDPSVTTTTEEETTTTSEGEGESTTTTEGGETTTSTTVADSTTTTTTAESTTTTTTATTTTTTSSTTTTTAGG